MASSFPLQIAAQYDLGEVLYFPVAAGQTFIDKALVYVDTGDGYLKECGADPALIAGIALAPASMGLATAGSIWGSTNIPVYVLKSSVRVMIASSTTPVRATHVGTAYGVVKSTYWLLDISDTGNARALVVDVSNTPQQECFYVQFIAANLQFDAVAS